MPLIKQDIAKKMPTKMAHTASLAAIPDGTLFCAWYGGSAQGASDTEIWFSTGTPVKGAKDDGPLVEWSEPVQVTQTQEAAWNPSLLILPERVLLFYKEGSFRENWTTFVMEGRSNPVYWGRPRPLVRGDKSGGRGPSSNSKPVITPSGRICAGGSTEREQWVSFCDYSDDGGFTWTKTGTLGLNLWNMPDHAVQAEEGKKVPKEIRAGYRDGRGLIQPVIWIDMGRLYMYMRSTEGYIYASTSEDGGASWENPHATEIPCNNSGFDVIRVPGSRIFMALNPVSGNWAHRTPLSLYMSDTKGGNWEKIIDLEKGPGEFSNPSLAYTHAGLWCAYTYKRKTIRTAFLSWQDIYEIVKFSAKTDRPFED